MPTLLPLLLSVLPAQPVAEPRIEPIGPATYAAMFAAPEEFPELEYTFVEASYVWLDSDSMNDTLDGWDLTGSFEFPMNIFVQAGARKQSADADLTRYQVGAGWHIGFLGRFDGYGILQYQSVKVDGSGNDYDDDGVAGELGVRFSLTKRIEFNARGQWSDVENSDASWGLGGRFYVTERLSAAANFDQAGNDNIVTVGVRFEL